MFKQAKTTNTPDRRRGASRKTKAQAGETKGTQKDIVSTQAEAARRLKVSRSTIHDWLEKGAPGEEGAYSIKALRAWHKAYTAAGETDPMFAGASSPALERYRLARAKSAELDLLERQGQLRDREEVREMLARFFGHITEAKAKIGTGVDPIEAIDAALDNCERVIEELRKGRAGGK